MIHTVADVRSLRAKSRLKLFEPTEMRVGGAPVRVHLIDVSLTGAQVAAQSPPARGEGVHLLVAGASRPARVMWVEGRRFGVHFRLALSEAELRDVVAPSRRADHRPAAAVVHGPASRA